MGISGLLPLLKDVSDHIHVSKYKGKVLGIDGYVWLHRGAYGCAEALAIGKPTLKFVDYAMANVNMLLHFGIIPYIVFDGDRLPAKSKTEQDRKQKRKDCLEQAKKFIAEGKRKEAQEYFARCVDVTPKMAYQLIKRLRKSNIQYIVAPYEADAQLAYLERRGLINGIITEDSDLLVFGCKTVLYKMDKEGNCVELLQENRSKCKSLPMHSFDDALFRQMAILSGCDYLPSIPKMGLKTAHQMLRKFGSVARVLNIALAQGMQIPNGYREAFEKAERTFVYQRVFDRSSNSGKIKMTTLTKPPNDDETFGKDDCIGPEIHSDVIEGIANGDIDPITRENIAESDEGEGNSKNAISSSTGTSYAQSFYRQTRTPFMNGRKGKPKCATQIPGQGKLDKFFSAKSNESKNEERKPFTNKTNQIARTREDDQDQDGSMKRIRLEESTINTTAKAKSKYFTQQVSVPPSIQSPPLSSSPTKVYDGSADLARFAMTPTQPRVIRRFTNEDGSEEQGAIVNIEDEDEGHISSPSVTASTEKGRGKELFRILEDNGHLLMDDVLSSSPYTSPSSKNTSLHHFNVKSDIRFNLNNEEEEENDLSIFNRTSESIEKNLSRFEFQQTNELKQFRSPNEFVSEMASDARRFANAGQINMTPGMSNRNNMGGNSKIKNSPFISNFTNSSSTKKTSLALNLEHDPFDDDDDDPIGINVTKNAFDTPLNALRRSSIGRNSISLTPNTINHQFNTTPNTNTKPESMKKPSSVRRMLMLERDA